MWENKKMRWIIIPGLIALVGFAYYNAVEDWRHPKASFVEEEPQPYVTAQVDTTELSKTVDRPMQEVVTIDMEEHKEPIFFTWEDIKVYYREAKNYIKEKINK